MEARATLDNVHLAMCSAGSRGVRVPLFLVVVVVVVVELQYYSKKGR